jgi:SPX domain protein involved in polyphosphate accumulation
MIRRFNRYELKYLVPVKASERIIEDIAEFTEPDPYGGLTGYPIVSLYYDSPELDFFWAKIEGIKFRRKLRIRIYPKDPIETTSHGMVEIKQRINRTVQKRRLKLPLDEAEQLCLHAVVRDDLSAEDLQVAAEVQYMVNAMHLGPTCITAYDRKAFLGGLYSAGLRITFDTDVRYRVHGLTVNQDSENHLIIPPDWCIMEIKANNAVPDWVTSLISRHNCQLRRVSKYCAGIAHASEHQTMMLAIAPAIGMEVNGKWTN